MGWRSVVHRITGRCMCHHWTLHKAEVRVELYTGCDGETLAHIELYKFGELVEEGHGNHGENIAQVYKWIEHHRP